MKKFLTAFALIAISVSILPTASGDVPEENFYPSVKQEAGWMGFNADNSIEYSQPSSLYALASTYNYDLPKKMVLCDSLTDSKCVAPDINSFQFTSIFTRCADTSDTDCIDSFSIKNEDGSVKEFIYYACDFRAWYFQNQEAIERDIKIDEITKKSS